MSGMSCILLVKVMGARLVGGYAPTGVVNRWSTVRDLPPMNQQLGYGDPPMTTKDSTIAIWVAAG